MRSRIVYHPQPAAVYHQCKALYIINFKEIVYHHGFAVHLPFPLSLFLRKGLAFLFRLC
jgi:hypothetical protein